VVTRCAASVPAAGNIGVTPVPAWPARGDIVVESGCSFGSLVSEVMKVDLDVGDEIAAGFDRWKDQYRSGLQMMRERGELGGDADSDQLAHVLMAAFQGGVLLAQAAGVVGPPRDALCGATAFVESHTPAVAKAGRRTAAVTA
jgi:Tetracyclin repressor-like, C-terminal domain